MQANELVTALITGASSGIGRATALALARRGARVVLVCRDEDKGTAALHEIQHSAPHAQARLLIADLASLRAVNEAADAFLASGWPLHVLINNAATWSATRVLSEDGLERTFAVNYLAHFLLTQRLLPRMRSSAPARVVSVSSNAVRQFARLALDDLQLAHGYGQLRAYRQSKLAQVLFTRELARRERDSGVSALCLHPGDVLTNMTARGKVIDLLRPFLPRVSAEQAAEAVLHVALAPELAAHSGAYFERGEPRSLGARARDDASASALYAQSLALCEPHLLREPELARSAHGVA